MLLTNEDLGYEQLSIHPIETDATANSTATSPLFKNNNLNVKVNHSDNGFDPNGKSYVFFKGASDVGGVTAIQLNSELFKVNNNSAGLVISNSARCILYLISSNKSSVQALVFWDLKREPREG